MNHNRVWATLTAVFAGVFAVAETDAIVKGRRPENRGKPYGTLSAWTQRKLGIAPKHPRRFVLVPIFLAVWGWLGPHITLRIWNFGLTPEGD